MQQSNFDNFSNDWWKEDGPIRLLHSMNETRLLFIKERIYSRYQSFQSLEDIFHKKKILDLGCGGGILTESLAKKGANITGCDTSSSLIKIAKKRASLQKLKINYKVGTAELFKKKKIKFDIILSLEVIEHVSDYKKFLYDIYACLNKDGIIILSTINRNLISYISTIFFAEKVLKLVPKGTHDWNKYIQPNEIIEFYEKYKLKLDKKIGLFPLPIGKNFKWIRTSNISSNYILSIIN
ncbi:bifunctional 2-polyprenyl-6-hydroxyphenol methylase/3-demethylubiquinol 3-O-methyltransferase UbiG [Alphaproteobacteria bacterium]|nr:bifunctional 2-polyprenyl-6-hydroxyphenol methylase/3-demethylubiquinol 3-O-methyltransferase UbiG [Alphaproteobacteria bacterium]